MKDLLATLRPEGRREFACALPSAAAFLLARLTAHYRIAACAVLPSAEEAQAFVQDLGLFASFPVLHYPAHEVAPYALFSPDAADAAERVALLYHLQDIAPPWILVVDAASLQRLTVPRSVVADRAELLMRGEDCDRDELARRLAATGYQPVSLVTAPGEFSVRGDILDVFPPSFCAGKNAFVRLPVRLEFFGDTVESIRFFDPASQRSGTPVDEVVLLPAGPVSYPLGPDRSRVPGERMRQATEDYDWKGKTMREITGCLESCRFFPGIEWYLPFFLDLAAVSLLDALPATTLVCSVNNPAVGRAVELFHERVAANYAQASGEAVPVLPPASLFLSREDWQEKLARRPSLLLSPFLSPQAAGDFAAIVQDHGALAREILAVRREQGLFVALYARIAAMLDADERVVLCCRSRQRQRQLVDLFVKRGLPVEILEPPLDVALLEQRLLKGILYCSDQDLSAGFFLAAGRVHFLSESQLVGNFRLGFRTQAAKKSDVATERLDLSRLGQGDIVVHRDHGMGVFHGIEQMTIGGVTGDFLRIEYAGGDRLFVPAHRLHLISRYHGGGGDKTPRLDKLGGSAWDVTKKKVKKAIWQVARDLLDLYAQRRVRQGHRFSPGSGLLQELEEAFPYDETPDQRRTIDEVLEDLASTKSMDRLVCGDVGFGKTEVAVRAAFKVIEDGFQAAVLVPTTILAEQHARTFAERYQGLPVTVACLNRFRSKKEEKKILADLASGALDLVIGTHRLLSKDVAFHRLGLLVIDEEHRFGVSHKEKIKHLRQDIDVLTLTATPIPRTLQLSLFGIRDMSVMVSPPQARLPVKTFVAPYEDLIVQEAINRELNRGGQVFFIHNRIGGLAAMCEKIQRLAPEARVAIAHGRMAAAELEETMVRFVTRQIDLLLCTTIVESGIDIASANTVIINRADHLGLADIYQLRGRVGRAGLQSYAYLLVPSLDSLKDASTRRLQALLGAAELGGGYQLALSDLEIRGGGNILGVSQSGHIAAVGYDMYLDLLHQTVDAMKKKGADAVADDQEPPCDPEINLRLSAYLPAGYISDAEQRFAAYRRLSRLATAPDATAAVGSFRDELRERYGPLPEEASRLFSIIFLKIRLARLWITRLDQGDASLVFSFHEKTAVEPVALLALTGQMQKQGKKTRLSPDGKLAVFYPRLDGASVAAEVENMVGRLEGLVAS